MLLALYYIRRKTAPRIDSVHLTETISGDQKSLEITVDIGLIQKSPRNSLRNELESLSALGVHAGLDGSGDSRNSIGTARAK